MPEWCGRCPRRLRRSFAAGVVTFTELVVDLETTTRVMLRRQPGVAVAAHEDLSGVT